MSNTATLNQPLLWLRHGASSHASVLHLNTSLTALMGKLVQKNVLFFLCFFFFLSWFVLVNKCYLSRLKQFADRYSASYTALPQVWKILKLSLFSITCSHSNISSKSAFKSTKKLTHFYLFLCKPNPIGYNSQMEFFFLEPGCGEWCFQRYNTLSEVWDSFMWADTAWFGGSM